VQPVALRREEEDLYKINWLRVDARRRVRRVDAAERGIRIQRAKSSSYVASWHLSEVVVPMRDVRSWGKTGSGQRWGEPTRLPEADIAFCTRTRPAIHPRFRGGSLRPG
jgi:hypothetical protein